MGDNRVNLDSYYQNGLFDPRQEIKKERHLESFFQDKFRRVNSYLKKTEPPKQVQPSKVSLQPAK